MYALGVDVGGTHTAVGLVDAEYRLAAKTEAPTSIGDSDALADAIFALAERLFEQNGITREDITHIGMAVPGPVAEGGSVLVAAVNLGLGRTPLAQKVSERFGGIPVRLINDADAAGLAELNVGSLKGVENGIMLTVGTGIGGALIFGGRLYQGGLGRGTEIGHLVVDKNGRRCSCGRCGCFETLASATALVNRAKEACSSKHGMIYSEYAKGSVLNAKLLIDCARAGDRFAVRAFEEYIDDFSSVLASIVSMLDPQVIAIGGGVSAAGEFLLEPLRKATARKCFFGSCGSIIRATAGNDAGMLGSVMPL